MAKIYEIEVEKTIIKCWSMIILNSNSRHIIWWLYFYIDRKVRKIIIRYKKTEATYIKSKY